MRLTGCVVAPVRYVDVAIGKSGFKPHFARLRTTQDTCLIVRLARDGENTSNVVETVARENCPCNSDAGQSPRLSARFKVTDGAGNDVEHVSVRRADRLPYPWTQVTDARGCLGVRWTVSPYVPTVSLVVEKSGFDPADIEVPTMVDSCSFVRLSPFRDTNGSTAVAVADEDCGCEMFNGRTVWPGSSRREP
jgi:hypothetical protein